jgi:hypothetical protein
MFPHNVFTLEYDESALCFGGERKYSRGSMEYDISRTYRPMDDENDENDPLAELRQPEVA